MPFPALTPSSTPSQKTGWQQRFYQRRHQRMTVFGDKGMTPVHSVIHGDFQQAVKQSWGTRGRPGYGDMESLGLMGY